MTARDRRWAVSFADICLLLLGFAMIAQGAGSHREALADTVRTHLGGRPSRQMILDPRTLFEPGEAVFRRDQPAFARFSPDDRLTITSDGADGASPRFDGWDLAAARAAAVARAATRAGAMPDRIEIALRRHGGTTPRLVLTRR